MGARPWADRDVPARPTACEQAAVNAPEEGTTMGAVVGAAGPRRSEAATLMTAAQLGERWAIPRSQVYRLTRSGRLPVVRLGRYQRYAVEAIEDFERSGGAA